MPEAFGGLEKGRGGGICPRDLGRTPDPTYRNRSPSLSLLRPRENDRERNSACLGDKPGRQDFPICGPVPMRIDLRGETYSFHSSCGLEGEGMTFCRRKEVKLSTGSERFKVLIPQITPDRCQSPIQLSRSHHVRTRETFDRPRPLD